MLVAASVALWRGWKIHTGHTRANGLWAGSDGRWALAVWHLTRSVDPHAAEIDVTLIQSLKESL